ncbi:hypothetical protein CKA32_005867 [Geitlerinema sp. FC II]|nr:hypothetical protein CKA32_005867 [Geitlerinema sp. FC II]
MREDSIARATVHLLDFTVPKSDRGLPTGEAFTNAVLGKRYNPEA